MDESSLRRIENDPNYVKLVSERKSLGWTLTIITLVIYYGFIAIGAVEPRRLSHPRPRALWLLPYAAQSAWRRARRRGTDRRRLSGRDRR